VYTEFFGLNEKPFSISPDPRYLYLSRRHADALAHLIYGISESGGFIQLTGEVGTGKTTLIRSLLEQLPDKAETALILNPQLSTKEFLESICDELRIPLPQDKSTKGFIDSLNVQLLRANAQDRRIVLIVDEAQTLSLELLEQVRLLTNLETAKKKLLQIILIGQPELRAILDRPDMRQVAQRITGRYHLEPLSAEDTVVYVKHRMKVAGAHADVFTPSAIRQIFKVSGGIPRLINIVADRALLAAYTQERSKIDGRLVRQAAAEVFGKRTARRWWPWAAAATGIAAFALTTATQYDARDTDLRLAAADLPPRATELALPATDSAPTDSVARIAAGADLDRLTQAPLRRLETLMAEGGFPTDGASATRELFRRWNATYDPNRGTICAQAESQRLQCLYLSRGSLGELRRLNLPAILTLTDASGGEHQVLLSGLAYGEAVLSAGDRHERIDVAELTHYWYGTNLLLWKPMLLDTDNLAQGVRGEGVRWLRDSLQQILATSIPADDPLYFDDALATQVREFQRVHRLTVDGVVGAQTQIVIQTELGLPGIPLLSEAR
jgi:general secretion pathway protein A